MYNLNIITNPIVTKLGTTLNTDSPILIYLLMYFIGVLRHTQKYFIDTLAANIMVHGRKSDSTGKSMKVVLLNKRLIRN